MRCSRLCYAPRKQWAWITGGLGSGVRVATPRITFLCCRVIDIIKWPELARPKLEHDTLFITLLMMKGRLVSRHDKFTSP